MVNKRAHKCRNCRKSYPASRIDQKYCRPCCRQAAYRKRKAAGVKPVKTQGARPLIPVICHHCGGTFWAKIRRAQFCSTSCRTMHHKALKAAIPDAIHMVYGLPEDKALDVIETQPIGKIRQILQASGYSYSHTQRRWVAQP